MTEMWNNWWAAHQLEIVLGLPLIVLIVVIAGICDYFRRKRSPK